MIGVKMPLPVANGLLLVGGRSGRMGRPKQLLVHEGTTLSERAVAALDPLVERVFLGGSGLVPETIRNLPQLEDPPGLGGPLAGVLGAMRRDPEAAWVVVACDMPMISEASVHWLLEQRRPGTLAVMPRTLDGRIQALLAIYEPGARPLLEMQAACGRWGLRHLAKHDRVACPTIPRALEDSWVNLNTPDDVGARAAPGV